MEMLRGCLILKLRQSEIPITNISFQQDGETSHTALASMTVLRKVFPGKLISRFDNVPCGLLDLQTSRRVTAVDDSGIVESKIFFILKPRTIPEFKKCISLLLFFR